jgi:phosphonate transport system permease protein
MRQEGPAAGKHVCQDGSALVSGAGGIGHSLYENIRGFQYSETAAIVIIVVLTVVLIDLVSARTRKTLV